MEGHDVFRHRQQLSTAQALPRSNTVFTKPHHRTNREKEGRSPLTLPSRSRAHLTIYFARRESHHAGSLRYRLPRNHSKKQWFSSFGKTDGQKLRCLRQRPTSFPRTYFPQQRVQNYQTLRMSQSQRDSKENLRVREATHKSEGISKLKKSGSPGAPKFCQMHKYLIIRYYYSNDGTSGLPDFWTSLILIRPLPIWI